MARGKHAAAATARRLHQAQQRITDLEHELAATKMAAHQREVKLREELISQGSTVEQRTINAVQKMMTGVVEDVASGISNAVWRAQRVAMTEHLTWLFLKGYVTWDRFSGDREVLGFLATHGDLRAWFILTNKHAHLHNYAARRKDARANPVEAMLRVIADIKRAEKEPRIRQERESLNAIVEATRDAFVNVELKETMTDEGWEIVEPTEDEVVLHQEVIDTLPEFRKLEARLS